MSDEKARAAVSPANAREPADPTESAPASARPSAPPVGSALSLLDWSEMTEADAEE